MMRIEEKSLNVIKNTCGRGQHKYHILAGSISRQYEIPTYEFKVTQVSIAEPFCLLHSFERMSVLVHVKFVYVSFK